MLLYGVLAYAGLGVAFFLYADDKFMHKCEVPYPDHPSGISLWHWRVLTLAVSICFWAPLAVLAFYSALRSKDEEDGAENAD